MIKKLIYKNKDNGFYTLLTRLLADCDSVLDVGCGANSPLGRIEKKRKFMIIIKKEIY